MPTKGIRTGGGTPKGEKKPQKRRADAKCGLRDERLPTFADVGRACSRFIRERVLRGEMRDLAMEEQIRAEARKAQEGRGE
jgi:hypothetical protein